MRLMKRPAESTTSLVAKNVERMIALQNWKIGALTKKSGISETMLRKIRAGDNVSLEILDRLADAFGIRTSVLLSDDLDAELSASEQLSKLRLTYRLTTDGGREMISNALKVAEELARYVDAR